MTATPPRHFLNLDDFDATTLRGMLESIVRYLRLHNESLYLRIEEVDGVVVLSQTLSTGRAIALRQAIELAVGGLHRIVEVFDRDGINIEYMYTFFRKDSGAAIVVLKIDDAARAVATLQRNGLCVLPEDAISNL